jgi:hypothetical protein
MQSSRARVTNTKRAVAQLLRTPPKPSMFEVFCLYYYFGNITHFFAHRKPRLLMKRGTQYIYYNY